MIRSGRTIHEACRQASSQLEAAGVQEARRQAELLLGFLFGWDRAEMLLRWQDPFPTELCERWEELIRRKASGEPVQYMIGEQEFYGLPMRVTPSVLIPRPETELLVEAVMDAGRRIWPQSASGGTDSPAGGHPAHDDGPADKSLPVEAEGRELGAGQPTLLDAGTGSGAIATTIAVHCPDWAIIASDLSGAALEVAQGNARRNGVESRIEWVQGDWLTPFLPGGPLGDRRIDIVVSNPPYIPSRDIAALQPEVRDYEPRSALDGGPDGLEPYRQLIRQLSLLSVSPRIVAFEVGIGQASVVAQWLRTAGWPDVSIIQDYSGIDRHVLAVRGT